MTSTDHQPLRRSSGVPEGSPHSGLFLLADFSHSDPARATFAWLGRLFIALSLIVFGVQHFLYSGFIGDLGLVPVWAPAHLVWASVAGIILLLAGFSLLAGIQARLTMTLLGFVFLCSAFLRFSTHIPAMIHNFGNRGVFFELLACAGGSWMLARTFPSSGLSSPPGHPNLSDALTARLATAGRWLFGISFVVFGTLHFQAPAWIASLIPHWIPFHLFLAWFTGCALVAAGLSIASQIWMRLSAALLGLMLFCWVVIVHASRIMHAFHDGDEWNSGFVCLAMAGYALIAATLSRRSSTATD